MTNIPPHRQFTLNSRIPQAAAVGGAAAGLPHCATPQMVRGEEDDGPNATPNQMLYDLKSAEVPGRGSVQLAQCPLMPWCA